MELLESLLRPSYGPVASFMLEVDGGPGTRTPGPSSLDSACEPMLLQVQK